MPKVLIRIRKLKNEVENRKSTENINKTKSWFFEKISKTDKTLAGLAKKKREKSEITNVSNERRAITTDPMDIKSMNGIL